MAPIAKITVKVAAIAFKKEANGDDADVAFVFYIYDETSNIPEELDAGLKFHASSCRSISRSPKNPSHPKVPNWMLMKEKKGLLVN